MTATVTPDLLHSPAYRLDPFPVWDRLREDQPLLYDSIDDVWIVTRYDDVAAVLRDWETYSTRPYASLFGPVIGRTLVEMDGEEHSTRRRLVAGAFVGTPLSGYRPIIDEVADQLVAALEGKRSFDAFDDFATVLPVAILTRILGLPPADHELFAEWPRRIMDGLWGIEPALSAGITAHREMGEYLQPLIDARRRCPHRDLISHIVKADLDGARLEDDEIKTFVSLLVNAGGDTTSHALLSLLFNILREPGLLETVRGDPRVIDPVFTETMRRDTPVTYENRTTTREVEWYGRTIPTGSTIRAYIGAAHTDDSVFADPRSFDPFREDLFHGRERRAGIHTDAVAGHLGFGLGRHFCIGYELARAAVVTGCGALLEQFDTLGIAEGTHPKFVIEFMFRRVDGLILHT